MKIVYWDDETKSQKERDMTSEELDQRLVDIDLASTPIVPSEVTRRQARQALFLNGYLDQVETQLNNIVDAGVRTMALIEWEDSLVFERNRPLVISIGTALGLDSEELDALFIQAATL